MDPNRRQKILDATLKVIIDTGLNRLTHRLVAKTARVPLGATTYYFGTIDELIEAAFRAAVERDRQWLQQRVEHHRLDIDPVAGVVALTRDMLEDTDATVLALELSTAALRNPRLRPLARAADEAWGEVLTPYLGRRRARLATGTMVAITLRGTMYDEPMSTTEITEIVHDALASLPSD